MEGFGITRGEPALHCKRHVKRGRSVARIHDTKNEERRLEEGVSDACICYYSSTSCSSIDWTATGSCILIFSSHFDAIKTTCNCKSISPPMPLSVCLATCLSRYLSTDLNPKKPEGHCSTMEDRCVCVHSYANTL